MSSCAIKIDGCSNIYLGDNYISGFDVGIDIANSNGVELTSNHLNDCRTGVKGRNVTNLKAQYCSHSNHSSKATLMSSTNCSLINRYTVLYLNVFNYNPIT
ncbi:hypothetical protein WAX86_06385 [Photobacterium damselae subsp. damselae]|uniref:hypothetical protein n=1 Tax=Photobacterium damselae TaxID=38293 RepID=UPI00311AF25E